MNYLINCCLYEQELLNILSQKIIALRNKHNIVPSLTTILVGNNPPSVIYVRNKSKKAEKLGIKVSNYNLDSDISEGKLLKLIHELNHNNEVNGILLQMPLTKHLDSQKIINNICPLKDVDGLHSINAGYLIGKDFNGLIPCTPLGIWYILKKVTTIQAKNAVVVGRSNLVGLPIALILNHENATVTICHSHTQNLKNICKNADILVAAIGKPNFITGEYIKQGATVIDVGINRVKLNKKILYNNTKLNSTTDCDYIITGDVNTNEALQQNALVTPVPKGVGRLTVVFLLYNTYKATLKQHNLEDDSYDIFF